MIVLEFLLGLAISILTLPLLLIGLALGLGDLPRYLKLTWK
jgi:hypothetical protein